MKLIVPFIHQELNWSCWHAAARMIYEYKKNACIHPLPKTWDSNTGLSARQFIELAKSVGFCPIPKVNETYSWKFLEDALEKYGPLWAAGQWNGPNHIIVITGVDSGGKVYINDPAFAAPSYSNIAWFNDKIDKNVDIPLMYLP